MGLIWATCLIADCDLTLQQNVNLERFSIRAIGNMSTADFNTNDFSVFTHKFNILSIKTDRTRWNKEWDNILRTLSAKEVYAMLSPTWSRGYLETSKMARDAETLKYRVREIQKMLVKSKDAGEEEHLSAAWLLLEERDQRNHLLKGLEEACEEASSGQDLRAMCPEIKISSLLKQKGRAYINFINSYTKGIEDADDDIYHLPSKWWNGAVDASKPLSRKVEFVFNLLTIQRNEFICESVDTPQ